MEDVKGQTQPSEAKKRHERVDLSSKVSWKFLNNLKNPLAGPIWFELQPQKKKDMYIPATSIKQKPQSVCKKARKAGFLALIDSN